MGDALGLEPDWARPFEALGYIEPGAYGRSPTRFVPLRTEGLRTVECFVRIGAFPPFVVVVVPGAACGGVVLNGGVFTHGLGVRIRRRSGRRVRRCGIVRGAGGSDGNGCALS